jgi:hypothetical protein
MTVGMRFVMIVIEGILVIFRSQIILPPIFRTQKIKVYVYTEQPILLVGLYIKLHNVELRNLYCSPNIVRVIKENEVGWACSMYGR